MYFLNRLIFLQNFVLIEFNLFELTMGFFIFDPGEIFVEHLIFFHTADHVL